MQIVFFLFNDIHADVLDTNFPGNSFRKSSVLEILFQYSILLFNITLIINSVSYHVFVSTEQ